MFLSAVIASLFATASPSLPEPWELSAVRISAEAQEVPGVTLVAEVSASRFFAVNATDSPQLVLFGSFGGAEIHQVVPANGTLDVRIPHGARGHYWVEFASLSNPYVGGPSLRRSGAMRLDDLMSVRGGSVWILGTENGLHASRSHRFGGALLTPLARWRTALDRAGFSLPLSLSTGGSFGSTHVPGVGPDGEGGDTPPDVGDDPLPPF